MALLSELPMSKITSSDSLNFAWKRHCSNFGISTQKEIYEQSHITQFIKAVQSVIENEKGKILFKKPINAILAAGVKLKTDNEDALNLLSNKITLLLSPDSDLDEREEKLSKAKKRLSKKIDYLKESLNAKTRNLIDDAEQELEYTVDSSCRKMLNIVQNEWKLWKSFDSIETKLKDEQQYLVTRKLKYTTKAISDKIKKTIKNNIPYFFSETGNILLKYLPDFNSEEFIESTQDNIIMEIDTKDLFSFEDSNEGEATWDEVVGSIFNGILNTSTLGIWDKTMNYITHSKNVKVVSEEINSISREFNPEPYLNLAFKSKDKVIEYVRNRFINELIEPLQEQLTSVRSKIDDKEQEIRNAEDKRKILEERKRDIEKQIEDIQALQTELS